MKQQAINGSRAGLIAAILLSNCMIKNAMCQAPHPATLADAKEWSTPLAGGAIAKPVDDVSLSHWWSVFGDSELTSLEERALKANLNLKTSDSEIRQARANRYSASGSLFPSLSFSGSGGATRNSTRSGEQYGGTTTTGTTGPQAYSAEFNGSWQPDFFGGIRKNVSAYDADIQAAQENLRNAMVTLTSELAVDYVNVRSYQAQLLVTKADLVEYKDTYEMTRSKRESGLSSDLDVQQALQTVKSTESTIPTLETNLRQTIYAIAVLLDERPGSVDAELAEVKPIPVIPAEVAVGIPADLLRRRPDVRSAERQVVAQWLRVGVAKANLYPSFTLTATFLFSAQNILNVLTPATLTSSIIGSVAQTLLNRRQLNGQVNLQNALLDQYEVSYQSTVLSAVQDVENSLQAFGAEQVRRKDLAEATSAAENAAEMSRELYAAGLKDFLTVLDSQRSQLILQNSLAQSDAAIDTDLIQLYQAMGGGW